MPNFYNNSGALVHAEQWFPGRPVIGVMQPHFGSMVQFEPHITINNFLCGEVTVPVVPGDWIVLVDNKETFVVKHNTLKTMLKPADDEAAIALGYSSLEDYAIARYGYFGTEDYKSKLSNKQEQNNA